MSQTSQALQQLFNILGGLSSFTSPVNGSTMTNAASVAIADANTATAGLARQVVDSIVVPVSLSILDTNGVTHVLNLSIPLLDQDVILNSNTLTGSLGVTNISLTL